MYFLGNIIIIFFFFCYLWAHLLGAHPQSQGKGPEGLCGGRTVSLTGGERHRQRGSRAEVAFSRWHPWLCPHSHTYCHGELTQSVTVTGGRGLLSPAEPACLPGAPPESCLLPPGLQGGTEGRRGASGF